MSISQVKPQVPGAAGGLAQAQKSDEASKASAAAAAKRAAAGYGAQAAKSPSLDNAANVQISPRAKEMSLAKSVAEATPEVREDKVAKYKDLIAKGEYKADSGKIADGILREAIKDDLSRTPDVALGD